MEILLGIALCLSFTANLLLSGAFSASEEENRELKTKLLVVKELLEIEKRNK